MADIAAKWDLFTLTDWSGEVHEQRPGHQLGLYGLTVRDTRPARRTTSEVVCGEWKFTIPGDLRATWLNESISEAVRLLSFPENWDLQGARRIDRGAIQRAIDWLTESMSENSSVPQWTPTNLSGVQLDWHENGIDLELSFEPGEESGYAVLVDHANPERDFAGDASELAEQLRLVLSHRLTS